MKQGISLPQLGSAGLGAEVAVGAIGRLAFKTRSQIEGADIIAATTVGAGFIRIGKLHRPRLIGLQQHLDQRIRASLFAEVFLIMYKQSHKPAEKGRRNSNDWKVSRGNQPNLIIQRLEKRKDDLNQQKRKEHRPEPDLKRA